MRKTDLIAGCDLLKAKFFRKRIPLVVGWSLTNRCNWRCRYCVRWSKRSEELTARQIFSIVDELSRMGTYSINFTGGEPLIRDDIESIIHYAKRKGIKAAISTNGSLLPQKIKDIKKDDPLVIISYDGPEEVHNKQRQKGSYRSLLDAITMAKKYNIFMKLHTVLTKYNINYVNSILELAREFDITVNFSVVEFTPLSEKETINTLLPPRDKYKSAFEYLISEKIRKNKNISNSLNGLEYLKQWPKYRKTNCCAGKIYCRIEPNGDVYPCGNLILKDTPPNAVRGGFENAFNKLRLYNCKSCWCDTRIEMNQIYSFNVRAILETKRSHKL